VQAVQEEGGFEAITREKKWPKIAVRLCYQASKNIGSTLRQHYEKTLYPFDVFMAGATADVKVSQKPDCKEQWFKKIRLPFSVFCKL